VIPVITRPLSLRVLDLSISQIPFGFDGPDNDLEAKWNQFSSCFQRSYINPPCVVKISRDRSYRSVRPSRTLTSR
jgi:hypothetical protein